MKACADVGTADVEASYAETLAVFAACEVDVRAAVEVYTAHTSYLVDGSEGRTGNCMVERVAAKESALAAVNEKNTHLHHRLRTEGNVQSVGVTQVADERCAVD